MESTHGKSQEPGKQFITHRLEDIREALDENNIDVRKIRTAVYALEIIESYIETLQNK